MSASNVPSTGRACYLELMLRPVDNDACNLLIHEQEYGEEEGGNASRKVQVDRKVLPGEGNDPATLLPVGRLKQISFSTLYANMFWFGNTRTISFYLKKE